MSDVFRDSAAALEALALLHESCLVFYSGGKDSLAVMDLCRRAFRAAAGVFMYFVPGLAVAEERLDYARRRWGVEFLLLPHWMLGRFLKNGVYCPPRPGVKELTLPAVHALARRETGVGLIAHGAKRADGSWRRRQMKATASDDLVSPLAAWNKWDVLSYLKANGIEPPGEKFDLDLSAKSLLWLHRDHPGDFARVCEVFPYAEAVVWRQRWYGRGG